MPRSCDGTKRSRDAARLSAPTDEAREGAQYDSAARSLEDDGSTRIPQPDPTVVRREPRVHDVGAIGSVQLALLARAQVVAHERALEIAGVTGYGAAVLAACCRFVATLDPDPDLSFAARAALDRGVTLDDEPRPVPNSKRPSVR